MDFETSRVPKTPWFSQKKIGFFLILRNHCSGVSDLKFEFYTKDLVQKRSDRMHSMAKKAFFDRFLGLFKFLECRLGTFSSPKKWFLMVDVECPDQKKTVGLFRRIFTHIPKKFPLSRHNSLCSSRSGIPHFLPAKVHIGRGLWNISGIENTVIFAKKNWFFWYCETIGVVSVTSNLNYVPMTS